MKKIILCLCVAVVVCSSGAQAADELAERHAQERLVASFKRDARNLAFRIGRLAYDTRSNLNEVAKTIQDFEAEVAAIKNRSSQIQLDHFDSQGILYDHAHMQQRLSRARTRLVCAQAHKGLRMADAYYIASLDPKDTHRTQTVCNILSKLLSTAPASKEDDVREPASTPLTPVSLATQGSQISQIFSVIP